MKFLPTFDGKIADYMYCEPPRATTALEILECANGLRPISDLDATIWLDTTDSLRIAVEKAFTQP